MSRDFGRACRTVVRLFSFSMAIALAATSFSLAADAKKPEVPRGKVIRPAEVAATVQGCRVSKPGHY